MKIGYARVSTLDQNLDLQIDALKKAGCEKIITDKFTGSLKDRPGFNKLRENLRSGDALIVWRLDRLGRTVRQLIEYVNELHKKQISFQTIQENIDTDPSSVSGSLMFHLFAAFAEHERNIIIERTQAGLVAARARGRLGGRPQKLNQEKIDMVIYLYKNKKHSIQQICNIVGISKPTLYKYLRGNLDKDS